VQSLAARPNTERAVVGFAAKIVVIKPASRAWPRLDRCTKSHARRVQAAVARAIDVHAHSRWLRIGGPVSVAIAIPGRLGCGRSDSARPAVSAKGPCHPIRRRAQCRDGLQSAVVGLSPAAPTLVGWERGAQPPKRPRNAAHAARSSGTAAGRRPSGTGQRDARSGPPEDGRARRGDRDQGTDANALDPRSTCRRALPPWPPLLR